MSPYFDTLADFFFMGGHGFYVWLCWGLVLASVLFGIIYARLERKRLLKQITQTNLRKSARLNKKPNP